MARYSFAHIKVLIDKNGEIQKLVDKKSKIPEKHLREFIRGSLDGYINYVFRSMKCLRAGDVLAARLEAAYSIPLFFDVIFAIHHRRLRPYYKYLRWELQTFPLIKLHLDAEELINSISKILDNADLEPQQNLLKLVETALRSEGYGDVFDSWGSDLTWMKTYRSSKNFERGFFTGESKIE